MKRNKIFKLLNWIIFAVLLVFSALTYRYLPDKVALHISFTGKLTNYTGKAIAAVSAPAILLLLNLYSSFIDKEKELRYFLAGIIILIAHIFIIYMNI